MNLKSNLNYMHVYKTETLSDQLEHFDLKCDYQHCINQLLKLQEFLDKSIFIPVIVQT